MELGLKGGNLETNSRIRFAWIWMIIRIIRILELLELLE